MVLIEIDVTYKANITSLAQYIVCAKGQYAPILRKHYYSVVSEKNLVKLEVNFREPENLEERQAEPTTVARWTRRKFVLERQKENLVDWKMNKKAGRFANRMEDQEIDENKSFEWLKWGILNYDN